MKFSFADLDDESKIKQLPAGGDLLHEAITPDLLEHSFDIPRFDIRYSAVFRPRL